MIRKKPIVITVTSNKGGVGKTTTAVAMSDILRKKYKVLLVDADPQANAASKFGIDEIPTGFGKLGELLISITMQQTKPYPIDEYLEFPKGYDNLSILFGGKTLKKGCYDYIFSVNAMMAMISFKKIFQMVAEKNTYDFIIVDTAPTYDNAIGAILNATDYVLLPTVSESDSVEGVNVALQFIANSREYNPNLKVAGIFLNRVYNADSSTRQVEPMIREAWGDKVLNTRIPDNRAAINKAINDGAPITTSKPESKASKAFVELTKEVIERVTA